MPSSLTNDSWSNRTVRKLAFAVPFLAALLALGPANADETFKNMEKEAFEKAVRTYILEHPEVIIEALEKYEAQERNAQEKAAAEALVAQKDKLFKHPMTPISGNRDGDVTVVEFFDYQCGFCKRTLNTVLEVDVADKAAFHHVRAQGRDHERRPLRPDRNALAVTRRAEARCRAGKGA